MNYKNEGVGAGSAHANMALEIFSHTVIHSLYIAPVYKHNAVLFTVCVQQ